jgi:hypothetical protein
MSRDDEKFCGNPRCVLHVSPGDNNVEGWGDWATLPNGRTFAREQIGDRFFCHVCAEDPSNPPQFDVVD